MSYRVCFDCEKAWYTRSTGQYAELRDEGIICNHKHYSYAHKNKGKIPDEIEVVRKRPCDRDE